MAAKFLLLTLIALSPISSFAADACGGADQAVRYLKNREAEDATRTNVGVCAVKNLLSNPAVAAAALHVIQDSTEDLFLREDLIQAFGDSHLRRQVKVEEPLAPDMDKDDQVALDRTVGGAGSLLAMAKAVKSMDETEALCPREAEFVKAISAIARNEANHVVLRSTAVESLEKTTRQMVQSGLYDDRTIRLAQDTLGSMASASDNASYFSGASMAASRLADSGLPLLSNGTPGPKGGRALASQRQ